MKMAKLKNLLLVAAVSVTSACTWVEVTEGGDRVNVVGVANVTTCQKIGTTTVEVKDDLVVWGENSFVYAFQNGSRIQVTNFSPKDYLVKNNVFAFRNMMGGVSALIDGKVHEITNQTESEYEIYGNSVLVKLFNRSYIVFSKGRKFQT